MTNSPQSWRKPSFGEWTSRVKTLVSYEDKIQVDITHRPLSEALDRFQQGRLLRRDCTTEESLPLCEEAVHLQPVEDGVSISVDRCQHGKCSRIVRMSSLSRRFFSSATSSICLPDSVCTATHSPIYDPLECLVLSGLESTSTPKTFSPITPHLCLWAGHRRLFPNGITTRGRGRRYKGTS